MGARKFKNRMYSNNFHRSRGIPGCRKYTNPKKIAIAGEQRWSAGGGVSLEKPDMFSVALPAVGVLGHAAIPEVYDRVGMGVRLWFGGQREEFKALLAYSPYHK